MRFGFSGNLVARENDPLGIWTVEKLVQFGYDFIELPICEVLRLDQKDYLALKKRISDAGIGVDVCNMFFGPEMRLTGPKVDDAAVEAHYRRVMETARDLGIQTIVFGSPGAKSYPEGFPHEQAYAQLVALQKKIDKAAGEYGLRVVIEPVRSPECNLIVNFKEGCRLAEEVGGANTGVLVDYYHMTWEGEPPEVVAELGKKWLQHVHFAAPYIPGQGERNVPLDFDEWPYSRFTDALKAIGYDQTVTIEAYTRDFESHAPKALALMKKHFAQVH